MSMRKEVVSRTIAGILSGVALAAIWWFWPYIVSFLSETIPSVIVAAWSLFTSFVRWLCGGIALQRWWFFVLLLTFAFAIGKPIVAWIQRMRAPADESEEHEVTFRDFTEFERFGVVWRWQWIDNQFRNIIGYCPRCDRPVKYLGGGAYVGLPVEISCTYCGTVQTCQRAPTQKAVEYEVAVEIDLAIRHGSFLEEKRADDDDPIGGETPRQQV